ncbi:MAG: hypothetical protein CMA05_03125 [Euryarchaeota archaeon]|nr:hypothetical protein [Euryarchaeota archaeon]MAK20286.1 hypothetical protein [Euryarchaeota archaeon]|tara:strand:- start:1174 stop:1920 length:747 start_codon:yes stop_codon:yes gene_type:complete
MILEDSTVVWLLLGFELVIAIILILGSKSQPFPTPARRFGWFILVVSGLLLLGQSAPNPTSLEGHLAILSVFGAFGLVSGINLMLRTRREVLVAPMSGFMFCVGVTGLITQTWDELNKFEHWAGFLALVVLAGGQTWLVFRGLLIGRLPLAWSQAGMVALHRGQLRGPHGAIECFEKAWDAEEEHLNPMAYSALSKIFQALDEAEKATHWNELFLESGGNESVAIEWLDAIDECLSNLGLTTLSSESE